MPCEKCARARAKLAEMLRVKQKKKNDALIREAAEKFHRRALCTANQPDTDWLDGTWLYVSKEAWDEFTKAVIKGYGD